MGVYDQHDAQGSFPPENSRCPLCRKLGVPQSWYGGVRKISPPPMECQPQTVHPVNKSLYQLRYLGPLDFTKRHKYPLKHIIGSNKSTIYAKTLNICT